jgi:hypothetical protein
MEYLARITVNIASVAFIYTVPHSTGKCTALSLPYHPRSVCVIYRRDSATPYALHHSAHVSEMSNVLSFDSSDRRPLASNSLIQKPTSFVVCLRKPSSPVDVGGCADRYFRAFILGPPRMNRLWNSGEGELDPAHASRTALICLGPDPSPVSTRKVALESAHRHPPKTTAWSFSTSLRPSLRGSEG